MEGSQNKVRPRERESCPRESQESAVRVGCRAEECWCAPGSTVRASRRAPERGRFPHRREDEEHREVRIKHACEHVARGPWLRPTRTRFTRATFVTVIVCVSSRFPTVARRCFSSPDRPRTFKTFLVSDTACARASVTRRPSWGHRPVTRPPGDVFAVGRSVSHVITASPEGLWREDRGPPHTRPGQGEEEEQRGQGTP